MRVSRTHATRALAAVRRRRRRAHHHRQRVARPSSSLTSGATPMTIEHALRTIDQLPRVRVHLVEAASARLAAGERPTAEDIAEMALRRATCDLLR